MGISGSKRVVHVCTFGDSLTEGLYNHWNFHPYSLQLEKVLNARFDNLTFKVTQFGVSGESSKEMIYRLPGL